MENSSFYKDLDSILVTEEDRAVLLEGIQNFTSNFFHIKGDFSEKIDECFPYRVALAIRAHFNTHKIDLSAIALEPPLKSLQLYLTQLDVVTLDLAFEPKRQLLVHISSWLSYATGHKYLIRVKVFKALLGGARIEYKGIYKDYSLLEYLTKMEKSVT